MRQVIIDVLIDRSTPEEFQFALRCPECGGEWHSSAVRFSKAGILPETEGKRVIFQTLYERERDAARRQAAAAAAQVFSLCPICGRLVCDRCFLICDDLDMCAACALRLQVPGAPVLKENRADEASGKGEARPPGQGDGKCEPPKG